MWQDILKPRAFYRIYAFKIPQNNREHANRIIFFRAHFYKKDDGHDSPGLIPDIQIRKGFL